ncbi:MAG: GGDEF domain-containing protein [Lachnospiraceae bacterium]|nr:GGDEF domain-containing protein [Lachnospiraceae bacterium]
MINMKRKTSFGFIVVLIVCFGLLIYIGNRFSVEKREQSAEKSYTEITDYTSELISAGEKGCTEDTFVYHIPIPQEAYTGQYLAVFSHHQNISVRIGDEEVYRLQHKAGENLFGTTPGIRWNFIGLLEEDMGKEAVIYVTSPYEDSVQGPLDIYIGEKSAICIGIIRSDFAAYLTGILILVVGIALIMIGIYSYAKFKQVSDLFYLGMFAIFLAVWLLNERRATKLFFSGALFCSYISFISLMSLPLSFILYVREQFNDKEHISWKILFFCSCIQSAGTVILQILNIADLRETLITTHIMIGAVLVNLLYHIIKEVITIGFSKRMKVTLFGLVSCVVAGVADIVFYYISVSGATRMAAAVVFLIWLIVCGVFAVRQTYEMWKKAKQAKHYEEMAYHDQLTGLYNRTAYEEFMGGVDVEKSSCVIVMFDLNDLKKCNDVYGHEAGDRYIVLCAKMISEVFEEIGTCCRIGGDEFCVIVDEENQPRCEKALKELDKKVEEANKQNREYEVHIAYGYAIFDKERDKELSDTRSRADANMYQMKFKMKEEKRRAAEEENA